MLRDHERQETGAWDWNEGSSKVGGRVMLGEKMERRKEGDETEEVNSNISGKHSNKSASF